ncbi:unnamed protein product [Amoebophrya sp. A25]|nr:unnamed protein product [Amoebophrya sp. A25]|eukprot:GSA25T00002565001.1
MAATHGPLLHFPANLALGPSLSDPQLLLKYTAGQVFESVAPQTPVLIKAQKYRPEFNQSRTVRIRVAQLPVLQDFPF